MVSRDFLKLNMTAQPKNNYSVLKYKYLDAGRAKCSLFKSKEDGVYSLLFRKEFITWTKHTFSHENKTCQYLLSSY
jgi:hypothetical protein